MHQSSACLDSLLVHRQLHEPCSTAMMFYSDFQSKINYLSWKNGLYLKGYWTCNAIDLKTSFVPIYVTFQLILIKSLLLLLIYHICSTVLCSLKFFPLAPSKGVHFFNCDHQFFVLILLWYYLPLPFTLQPQWELPFSFAYVYEVSSQGSQHTIIIEYLPTS